MGIESSPSRHPDPVYEKQSDPDRISTGFAPWSLSQTGSPMQFEPMNGSVGGAKFDGYFHTAALYPKSLEKGKRANADGPDSNPDMPIDASIRREVIDNIGRSARESYIFPEKGEAVDRMLHTRMSNGEYDGIKSAEKFADKLTEDIRALTGDLHFRVDYSQSRPYDDALGEKPPPKLDEKFRREAEKDHFGVHPAEFLDKDYKIGYLRIDGFANPADAAKYINQEMKKLSSAEALIIDLRKNRGGDPHSVKLVADTLLPNNTHINDIVWRKDNNVERFYTSEPPAGTRFGAGKPVYVLISHDTFSGGEELANDLKMQNRATLIGQSTGGGANPGRNHRVQDHFSVFVPDGRSINPVDHGNWEGTGVAPNQFVPPSEDSKAVALALIKAKLGLK